MMGKVVPLLNNDSRIFPLIAFLQKDYWRYHPKTKEELQWAEIEEMLAANNDPRIEKFRIVFLIVFVFQKITSVKVCDATMPPRRTSARLIKIILIIIFMR